MWAQTRFIPGVLLVQFRPTALFSFSIIFDLFCIDWFVVFGVCTVLPFCFVFGLFIFLFYLVFWRRTFMEVRSARLSGRFYSVTSFLWSCLFILGCFSWHAPSVSLFQEHLILDTTSLMSLEAVVCVAGICLIAPFFFTVVFFNELLFFVFMVGFSLFFLVGVLSLVTNLYTIVFVVEFVNLVVFLLLCLTRVSFLPRVSTRNSLFSGLLVFF